MLPPQPPVDPIRLPPRMSDIARQAGVSPSTVSHVLSGRKGGARVSAKTAAEIRRIAARLNFHPSHAARQLRGVRSRVVAVLANNIFHQPQLRAFSWLNHLASTRGLETLAWETDSQSLSIDDYVGKCLAWNIDGLIFVTLDSAILGPKTAQALSRLPRVVSLFDDPGIPGGYCIDFDSAAGVRQAVAHLHGAGRRKIIQILENLDTPMSRRRRQAFLAAHQELGRPLAEDQVCLATQGWDRDDFPKFAALCDELIDGRGGDAILADNDFTAASLAKALQRRGLRVPDDVAVIGWGNETLAGWMNPALSSVNYRMQDMVTAALDLLTGLIEEPDKMRQPTIVIKPELILRESG